MKKLLQSAALWALPLLGMAQSIPNGSLENWSSQPLYEMPTTTGITTLISSNSDVFGNYDTLNMTKLDLGGGNFAAHLETSILGTGADTVSSFVVFGGFPSGQDTLIFPGGYPVTEQITSVTFNARYTQNSASPGFIIVSFRKNGQPVGAGSLGSSPGNYVIPLSGTVSTFTEVTVPILPALSVMPDSVVIGIGSNNLLSDSAQYFPGDFVDIDYVRLNNKQSLTPGTDFDTWQMKNLPEQPDGWLTFVDQFHSPNVTKSSMSSVGSSSIKMETVHVKDFDTNQNDTLIGLAGIAGYDQNTSDFKEGFGFNTTNTYHLSFDYKYSTPGNDTAAAIILITRDNGLSEDSIFAELIDLDPTGGVFMSKTSVSFDVQPGDSAVFIFFSSYEDENHLNRTDYGIQGSALWIDNVKLEIVTGINENATQKLSLYPNPVVNTLHVAVLEETVLNVEAVSATGDLFSLEIANGTVDVSTLEKGIYQLKITTEKGSVVERFVKQ